MKTPNKWELEKMVSIYLKGHQIRTIIEEWVENNVEGFKGKRVRSDLTRHIGAEASFGFSVQETTETVIPELTL